MSSISAAMRSHHRELAATLNTQVTALEENRPDVDPEALVTFLQSELLPHARGEERYLYPAIEPVIKAHGAATATMRVDHEFIETTARQIADTVQALRTASGDEQGDLRRRLLHLAWQLQAVLQVHLEKEERVYLPLVERYIPAQEQEHILTGMHEDAAPAMLQSARTVRSSVLDVCSLPPAQRHELIFQAFAALAPGESFILVNDHDPKPLYYQLSFEYQGQLVWDYLEEGPETWRVRIGKAASNTTA
jgi:uncharacterized protein (DUF2249 family)/hemerythrin-like domain-containing protein